MLKVWSKRHRDLARARNQVACRLHAVLCDLVPGGVSKEITAAQAARILEQVTPSGAVEVARGELAAEFLDDLRRLDAQLRETKKKLAAAVKASGTTLTEVFGVGPVIAGTVIGDVGDVSRFPGRDHFAAYNGTAPVEVSSGNRKIYRLSLRGNRRINHAIHMAAITQIRHQHSDGRAYYEQEAGRGQDPQRGAAVPQAADQRRHLRPPPGRRPPGRAARAKGPGGQPGNDSVSSAAGYTPHASSSDKPLPDPPPPYDPAPLQAHRRSQSRRKLGQPLDTNSKEDSLCTATGARCSCP